MTADQIIAAFTPNTNDQVEWYHNIDGTVTIVFDDLHGNETCMTRNTMELCMADRAAYLATQFYGRAH